MEPGVPPVPLVAVAEGVLVCVAVAVAVAVPVDVAVVVGVKVDVAVGVGVCVLVGDGVGQIFIGQCVGVGGFKPEFCPVLAAEAGIICHIIPHKDKLTINNATLASANRE